MFFQKNTTNCKIELPAEMAVLVASASSHLSEEQKALLAKLLTDTLDWDTVINFAQYHKVLPLLHKTLTAHFKKDVPAHALERITSLMHRNSLNALVTSASLIHVLQLLKENGIDVLPVKGPMLAEKLYGSVVMRTYGDVDILVHHVDLVKTLNILLANKYTLLPEGIPQSTFLKFLQYNHHGRLLDRNGILIELHWELSGFYIPSLMTMESLRPFLYTASFNNCPTFDLTDEMLFLFLCLHGNKHRWEKLDFICSIAQLLDTYSLDWTSVIRLSKEYNMVKRVLLALVLSQKLFSSHIPPHFDKLISANSTINELADKVIGNELSPLMERKNRHPFQKSIKFQLSVMDSKQMAIKFIFRSIIVPEHEDWHQLKLPVSLFFLYYFYKPYCILMQSIIERVQSLFQFNCR